MSDFPDNCIRGIQKLKNVYQDTNTVSAQLFIPDERTIKNRSDGGQETSINWEDDETVLDFTLNQKDENDQNRLLFPNGAVKLPRSEMDKLIADANISNAISYERNPLANNVYHGNIVFRDGLSKPMITMIANVLALYCSEVIRK